MRARVPRAQQVQEGIAGMKENLAQEDLEAAALAGGTGPKVQGEPGDARGVLLTEAVDGSAPVVYSMAAVDVVNEPGDEQAYIYSHGPDTPGGGRYLKGPYPKELAEKKMQEAVAKKKKEVRKRIFCAILR